MDTCAAILAYTRETDVNIMRGMAALLLPLAFLTWRQWKKITQQKLLITELRKMVVAEHTRVQKLEDTCLKFEAELKAADKNWREAKARYVEQRVFADKLRNAPRLRLTASQAPKRCSSQQKKD